MTSDKDKKQAGIERYELLETQIDDIKRRRKRRRLSSSRLNRYLNDILYLRMVEEASYADIALWLRQNKRIRVTKQAVQQFTKKHLDTVDKEIGING
ncbi:hypothetical protein PULV_a4077 [Pseudoalteromonas ulvae UL12]|uniref:hypothetical protein n=1 Tax=Pseudoalteromonas ulvae TaxID=107327 RepID=UPI00186B9C79|nr:hypothetical protein [Pseudoalteromonas ulvae]MBE0362258.1 hypothetical protein [Pseudoalteromonas ulvae UL12]